MIKEDIKDQLYSSIDEYSHSFNDPNVAHLTINENKVLSSNTVEGLDVDVEELDDGVDIKLRLEENRIIQKPVHLCFGVIPQKGIQRILLDIVIGRHSHIVLNAHCSFPFALDVQHIMEARIVLEEGAHYSYFERHIHSDSGGVHVLPKAVIHVGKNAQFKTKFELLKGRVGVMDIDYITYVKEYGLVDMTALVSGRGEDSIKLSEISYLEGDYARAVLTSKIAVRDDAKAEIHNKIVALAPYTRGHVDCKEIVKDKAEATAIPIVDVRNAKAHVTHEAAIGSVDKKQLETLMARGLDEDKASELIIQGLLS